MIPCSHTFYNGLKLGFGLTLTGFKTILWEEERDVKRGKIHCKFVFLVGCCDNSSKATDKEFILGNN
jgi:hypothetical protein